MHDGFTYEGTVKKNQWLFRATLVPLTERHLLPLGIVPQLLLFRRGRQMFSGMAVCLQDFSKRTSKLWAGGILRVKGLGQKLGREFRC